MIRTEDPSSRNFILFCSGAPFGYAVLQALRARNCLPRAVVLPQYPPAQVAGLERKLFRSTDDPNPFAQLLGDLPLEYAPRAGQREFADRLSKAKIDYILVACWPYLIDDRIIASAVRAALNLHPSMLPAFRGADPLGAQIAARSTRFGVSLHLLDQRFDHGDIVAQAEVKAERGKVSREWLENTCAIRGVELFIEAMKTQSRGWQTRPQQA